MTVPHGDLEALLRRELTAAVDSVEPAPDALERIRARTAQRPPQPWLVSVLNGAVSRAQHWVWRGHWVWPDSLPRPRAVAWQGARWAKHARRSTGPRWTMGANWLRPVAVLAAVGFIAIVTLAVPPLRQAVDHVTSNVLTGGQTSGGAGTDGNGTQDGGGGGTLTNGEHNPAGTNSSDTGGYVYPGSKATPRCQPAAASATPTGSSEQIAAAVSSALPATPAAAVCVAPTATATASLPVTSPSGTSPGSAAPTSTPTSIVATETPTATQQPTDTDSPTSTPTDSGSPTATPTDSGTSSGNGSTTVGAGTGSPAHHRWPRGLTWPA